MNCHSTSCLLSYKVLSYDYQKRSYEVINKGEQYNYYNTYLLTPLRRTFQLLIGCHVWRNTIEYIVDYSKQNGTDFRFMG